MVTREYQCVLWGESITAVLHRTGNDCAVFVAGGLKEHVGAVSLCSEDGAVRTLTLAGHKDQFITEPWSLRIHEVTGSAVSVSAGIHYDNLTKEQIAQVMDSVNELLGQLLSSLRSDL